MNLKKKLKNSYLYKSIYTNSTNNALLIAHPFITLKYRFMKSFLAIPKVVNIENSIHYIIDNHVSVSRFGDGEFRWIEGAPTTYFQDNSIELSNRLKEILVSNEKKHIVCIPNIFSSFNEVTKENGLAWEKLLIKHGKRWLNYFDIKKKYFDANLSRPYIDRKDKNNSSILFSEISKIWDKKDVFLVEGSQTRFGVGNNLLSNANSIHRIICPTKNAFGFYDKILKTSIEYGNSDTVFLVALGPTATVLCYDLCKFGIQAIDIGHLDIEYEWFLKQVTHKEAVYGKYVNEVQEGRIVEEVYDAEYDAEIVYVIE
ncbi:SP_1767 family glycosyltransferase [Loigolactobacillus coryniformis]|uniref:SP_1767 family glycosyltransferase n=1 Tax=Loigolactobacillus coryniformis TaxID=1610 RepID=A0A5B8TJQ1_9LACO|nr:SP_1767 family glycosyltransferase [Loigolactobacillus coryniformis]QEA52669.1 SP_1767 family glycosyltransferase [Loigolactobacillus coryniformis]